MINDLSALKGRLDEQLPNRMRLANTPGVAIAVIRNGALVWTGEYGWANLAAGAPVEPGCLFGVASISKPVTAWGMMRLVEQGKINLDHPLGDYLTRWRLPASQYGASGVTLRRLLSHSAGLNTPEYLGYLPGEPLPSIEQVLSAGSGKAPGMVVASEPGARFAYSDGGYLLLQLLIEEVTGERFETYMQREVLDALNMPDSTFDCSPQVEACTVVSYDSRLKPLPNYQFVEKAPAGLFTTAAGLAVFAAAAMPGPQGEPIGRGVLHPETVQSMFTPQVEIIGFDRLIYAHGYGLGYFTELLPDGRRLVSHMGENLNGVTEFAILPETGDGIVILTNGMSGHEVIADALNAWTDWLGVGAVTLGRAIRTARRLMFAAAGLLAGIGLLLTARLLSGALQQRIAWIHPGSPDFWPRLAAALLIAVFLILYFARLHQFLQYAMPSAARWLALGATWLLLALAATMVFPP